MLEYIIIAGFIALFGYGLYKVLFKKETPAEAVAEIKNEIVAEVKKVEEAAAPVVVAEVAKVEEAVVAEVKKVATRAKAAAKKTADVNKDGKVDLADAKAVAKKVATKVTEVKKPKA